MKQIVCELGGYEVLLHGNADDARRAVYAKAHEHDAVVIHNTQLQAYLDRVAELSRLGILWWGPRVGFEEWNIWVMAHDVRTGAVRPDKERVIKSAVNAAMKELGVL